MTFKLLAKVLIDLFQKVAGVNQGLRSNPCAEPLLDSMDWKGAAFLAHRSGRNILYISAFARREFRGVRRESKHK